jgi:fructose 1,6-bisphosphatase
MEVCGGMVAGRLVGMFDPLMITRYDRASPEVGER